MKKWLKLGLVILIVLIIIFLGISAYLGYSMTRTERVSIEGNPGDFGLTYENVTFHSVDEDITLCGWYLPVQNGEQIIIMVHGDSSNRADSSIGMLDITSQLVKNGYAVLTFDLRGHGESDGNMKSAGYHEKYDLAGAVEYVKSLGFEDIGVIGFSMGAGTALLTSAENVEIDALVIDSGFADLKDVMEPEFSKRTKFPKFFLKPLLFMVRIMYGVDFTDIKPIESVSEIVPRPIFFIHGELDDIFSVEHAERLLEASGNPQNQLWIVPQAEHVMAYRKYPEEYMKRVIEFFNSALR
jgi:fermentation-respiration switch protein FrsA (DUF1100 family)